MDDDTYDKRASVIASRYLKTAFFLDFFACVPVLIYEAMYKFSTEKDIVVQMISSEWYVFWSFLKILKLG